MNNLLLPASTLFLMITYASYAQRQETKPEVGNSVEAESPESDTVLKRMDTTELKTIPNYTYFLKTQEYLVIRDNLMFSTTLMQKSQTEKEIWGLEEIECRALLKRDTATLEKLWARDFTLDAPLNRVVESKNPLPHYLSFTRMVEDVSVINDVVYTRGYEFVWPLEIYSKLADPVKRRYAHVWMRKNGSWKLVAKYITEIEK